VSEDPLDMVDGPNAYAYVLNNSIVWTDELGLTWQSNWNFYWDWVLGRGGEAGRNRSYGPGSVELGEMQNSIGAEKLREAFSRNGCQSRYDVTYGTYEAAWNTLLDPFTADLSSTSFQVGGFGRAWAVNNGNGTVTYRIRNRAGTHSFFYGSALDKIHLGWIVPDAPWTAGPMRTVEQTFQWTEPLPCGCK